MEASSQVTVASLAGCLTLSKSGEKTDISLICANRTASSSFIYNTRGKNLNMYVIMKQLFSSNNVDIT